MGFGRNKDQKRKDAEMPRTALPPWAVVAVAVLRLAILTAPLTRGTPKALALPTDRLP